MWSHYADKHLGACLRFDTTSDFFEGVGKVVYSDEYPDFDFIQLVEDLKSPGEISERARKELASKLLLTKSAHWRYEQEWRLGKFPLDKETVGFQPFPAEGLTGIIFGVWTPKAEIQKIQKQVGLSKCNPVFFKAEVSRTKFQLEIEPLSA
jgi:Protein of unknown function (DUF2971)